MINNGIKDPGAGTGKGLIRRKGAEWSHTAIWKGRAKAALEHEV